MQVHTTVKNLLKSDLENQAGRTYDTKSKVMISTLSIAVHWICLGIRWKGVEYCQHHLHLTCLQQDTGTNQSHDQR